MDVWKIAEEIAGKDNWYTKIYKKTLVKKWRKESKNPEAFDLAIGLLKATVQGMVHYKSCTYVAECDECIKNAIAKFKADPETDKKELRALEKRAADRDRYEFISDDIVCPHVVCKCKSPDCALGDYVCFRRSSVDWFVKSDIDRMVESTKPIWHPDSDEQVRDIIHPSLWCYVRGTTPHADGTVLPAGKESDRHQWLPSDFEQEDGNVKLMSRINGLDSEKFPSVASSLTSVLQKALPDVEKVIRRKIPKKFQAISKVSQIVLTAKKPKYGGGVWHIEGMPHEHIIATVVCYLDSHNITPSFLEFRKPLILNEMNLDYPQSDEKYTTHHYGVETHWDGQMNRWLGAVRTTCNTMVVFPNTLQHRVKPFELISKATKGIRTIIAFFIIDPDHRILSTADIPDQMKKVSLKEAIKQEKILMRHRKYFVDEINKEVFERPYSLCEH